MPKFIPKKDVLRLFPYRFFEELDQVLTEDIPMNIAYVARETSQAKRVAKNPKMQFDKNRNQLYGTVMTQNNLHTFEQGTFLLVETYVKKADREAIIRGKTASRRVLMAQYFDREIDDENMFDKGSPLGRIKKLTPMHVNDPDLILAFMDTMTDADTKEVSNVLTVIQAPNEWLENIKGPWQHLSTTDETTLEDAVIDESDTHPAVPEKE